MVLNVVADRCGEVMVMRLFGGVMQAEDDVRRWQGIRRLLAPVSRRCLATGGLAEEGKSAIELSQDPRETRFSRHKTASLVNEPAECGVDALCKCEAVLLAGLGYPSCSTQPA